MAGLIEETWWAHLSDYALLPPATLERKEGYTSIVTDVPSSFPNAVFRVALDPSGIEERIEEALEPYRQKGLPLNWWIGPGTRPPDLAARLLERGFERSLVLQGMYRSLKDLPSLPPRPKGLVFREVEDREELSQRVELNGRAYGIDRSAWPLLLEMYAKLGHGPGREWRHLTGYLEGGLVVAASLQLHPKTAVIHNVGTLPALRRQGLATAATLVALELARQERKETVVLQATGAGARLYDGLGFRECCELSAYTLAGEDKRGVWREPVRVQEEGSE